MHIGRSDVIWSYLAIFMKIGASLLLLPFILKMMPPETVGVWTIFITITSFINLLDFGFNPSFTRNVTYVFSGVRRLKANGIVESKSSDVIDYYLLKGLINTMRWFYTRVSIVVLLLLLTIGSYYIHYLLQSYSGQKFEVYVAWFLLCIINATNLYTQYYDSLLQGKGLIKVSKQIIVFGQLVYLSLAILLVMLDQGLIAVVLAQASAVFVVRMLSYRSFFTSELYNKMEKNQSYNIKDILQAIYPNALKIGLTSLGGFAITRSSIIIGSLYLTLNEIASYGITMQIVGVISALSTTYTTTFTPKISQYRIQNDVFGIKDIYLKGQIVLFITFILCGLLLLSTGSSILSIIGSKTSFLPNNLLTITLIFTLLENNLVIAGGILVTTNNVPFFKSSLYAGVGTILLLFVFLHFFKCGVISLILAPGIVLCMYQNWRWPYEVHKDLSITLRDYAKICRRSIMRGQE